MLCTDAGRTVLRTGLGVGGQGRHTEFMWRNFWKSPTWKTLKEMEDNTNMARKEYDVTTLKLAQYCVEWGRGFCVGSTTRGFITNE
jgi:hypothetical protein